MCLQNVALWLDTEAEANTNQNEELCNKEEAVSRVFSHQ
jgi:hypothetical protein